MNAPLESNLLTIGGIEFCFPFSISWPNDGDLVRYHGFIGERAGSDCRVNVGFNKGEPALDAQPTDVLDSGDGTRWSRVGTRHLVQKLLPHVAPAPLWSILIDIPESTADVWFSEKYLELEELCGDWPVAAPRYPIDQHLAVHFLAGRNGALVHSAGIGLSGSGFMCSGVSGAGKTTISRLLAGAEGFDLLTDDRVVLRVSDSGETTMYGTPWSGEGQYATAGTAPLKAVFFIRKADKAKAERLPVQETVSRFMPVTSVPWFSTDMMTETMKTIEVIAQTVPAYELCATKSADTIDLIREIMRRPSEAS